MPTPESIVAFAIAAIILIVIPGPSVLFVIGRSLSYGRRGGLLSVVGNTLGTIPLVIAVAFGVGAVVAQSIMLFTIVKVLGAAYLVYLGVQAFRHRASHTESIAHRHRRSTFTMLGEGFIVGITNPKTIVFFVAVLPQFVYFPAGNIPFQMMLLGFVAVTIGLVCDTAWALLAGTAQVWFARSPRRLSSIRGTGGILMIALGGTLALTGNRG
ncbi:LysE family translocator [Microbacterium sp. YY-01]|uniref:LysE family translocator n=1 Tax=Microbacterium sp. YY-01 TaxID=3421634 RepID=UPI003D164C0D